MYYPDLTLYCYFEIEVGTKSEGASNSLNVGWLDVRHPFPKKKATEELLNILFERCLHSVNQTRGFHACQFCRSASFGLEVSRNGKDVTLGSAEIRVKDKNGKVYVAPNLIYHYVAEHDYNPPKEFIDALFQ